MAKSVAPALRLAEVLRRLHHPQLATLWAPAGNSSIQHTREVVALYHGPLFHFRRESMADRIDFKISGLDNVLNMLKQLPAEVVSKKGGPVRAAMRKGAVVLRDQARANVRAIVAEPNADGRPSQSTGALEKAITARRSPPPGGVNGEYFVVGPTKRSGVGYYARFLEYGTSRMRARFWLRSAFASRRDEAVRVVQAELLQGIERVTQKLLKQSGGK